MEKGHGKYSIMGENIGLLQGLDRVIQGYVVPYWGGSPQQPEGAILLGPRGDLPRSLSRRGLKISVRSRSFLMPFANQKLDVCGVVDQDGPN